MYFWNIAALKQDLKEGTFTEAQGFAYFFAFVFLYSFTFTTEPETGSDYLYWLLLLVVDMLGYYYTYKCNGGAAGKNYLAKITSLSFVYSIRFTILFIFPLFIVFYGISYQYGIPDFYFMTESVVAALISAIFFFKLGQHIKETV